MMTLAPLPVPGSDADLVVTAADAFADTQFFEDHPDRRYHRRSGPDGATWLIRRRVDEVHLCTLVRAAIDCPDTDEALREAWFAAAWPDLDPPTRDKLLRAARQAERAKKATKRAKAAPRRQGGAAVEQMPDPLAKIQNEGEEQ